MCFRKFKHRANPKSVRIYWIAIKISSKKDEYLGMLNFILKNENTQKTNENIFKVM
jgi:hypothetical protein